jgi:predicted ATPase/class 3 adenylate cyclase
VVRRLPTGTVTFLFTDIEGSTRLLQALGVEYRDVLERHASLLRGAIAANGGVEVSTEGDAFFAVFESAAGAVAAAVAGQRALHEASWPGNRPVRVRMGLHTGEGVLGGDNYVGLDVHRAARIAAAGHGGQVVISSATRELVDPAWPVGVALREAGTHRLKDLDRPETLFELVIDGTDEAHPPLRTLETPSNLPVELTSFVGRGRELDEIEALFEATRLVTLVGPGGTGKTRLALRAAARLQPSCADGVFFVDLAALTDPDLVAPEIARTIGVADEPGRAILDGLRAYLAGRELLLVLDNFEQLLPAAGVVADLFQAAPRLRLLVTSRALLNVYGERRFDVPPLALPSSDDTTDVTDLSANEAVGLFAQRALAARHDFALDTDVARTVAEICRRLDGLPLAIELAASRVALLEPAEILARLRQRLPVLAAGASNAPARQRTLTATIGWSYDLLDPSVQPVFRRLSIFAGGWTLEAAEAIANPDGEPGSTLDVLAELVGQSLVRRIGDRFESRFTMLETIRAYAANRLAEEGEAPAAGMRHSTYFRDLARRAAPHLRGADETGWLARVDDEQDNVRAVLDRSIELGDTETGLFVAASLWRFWLLRGYLREGRARLEALLALDAPAPAVVRARAYAALGGLAYWLSDPDATEAAYESALLLAREAGDIDVEAEAIYDLAFVPVMRFDPDEARRRFEASIAAAMRAGRDDLVAETRTSLGMFVLLGGELEAGLALIEAALAYQREQGDQFNISWTLAARGEGLRLLGRLEESQACFLEGLERNQASGNLPGIASSLNSIVSLESTAERHARAMRLKGVTLGIQSRTGASAPPLLLPGVDAEVRARAAIGDAAVDVELARGGEMHLDDLRAYAGEPFSGLGPPGGS